MRRPALVLAGLAGVGATIAVFGPVGAAVAVGVGAGLWVRGRRARARSTTLPVTADLPVVVGLLAAGVRAGATVPSCLTAVARSTRGALGEELAAVAQRLRLGADPATAWRNPALPEPLAAVGRDLARAADTGAPVADLLDRHAADLRRALRAEALARMERLGVLVVAPLGLCFLPAFVLIGIVPMAAELLTGALGA
ncbi:type II secretion system F family protein [Nocardiopsis sp. NPDC050513]|uniref:type II secretion system F family protein n=1 Tax=Nocardiopsis sp. NPDC050513 TaxID=3364338 RepID=UPI0037BA83EE